MEIGLGLLCAPDRQKERNRKGRAGGEAAHAAVNVGGVSNLDPAGAVDEVDDAGRTRVISVKDRVSDGRLSNALLGRPDCFGDG